MISGLCLSVGALVCWSGVLCLLESISSKFPLMKMFRRVNKLMDLYPGASVYTAGGEGGLIVEMLVGLHICGGG